MKGLKLYFNEILSQYDLNKLVPLNTMLHTKKIKIISYINIMVKTMTGTTLNMENVNINYAISKLKEEIEEHWDILLE